MSASILCTTIPGALYLSLPTKIFVWPSFKVVQIWWVSLSGFGDVKSSSHEFSRAWNQARASSPDSSRFHQTHLIAYFPDELSVFQHKWYSKRAAPFVFFLYSGNLPFIDKLLIILQTSFNPSDIRLRTCQSRKSIVLHFDKPVLCPNPSLRPNPAVHWGKSVDIV